MNGIGSHDLAEPASRAGNILAPSIVAGRGFGRARMSHGETRALRAASASAVAAAQDSDDDFDFPPTAHPGRELFTASLFVLLAAAFFVWVGSKLIFAM